MVGALNEFGLIDEYVLELMMEKAQGMEVTFHRAFDVVTDVYQSLENVIECGFRTILTSGQKENVVEGISILGELVKKANNRIIIMPGGGLRSTNIGLLKEKTNATFYHSSAIVEMGETANAAEIEALKGKIE
mgnify:CR=1 FL=1